MLHDWSSPTPTLSPNKSAMRVRKRTLYTNSQPMSTFRRKTPPTDSASQRDMPRIHSAQGVPRGARAQAGS